MVKRQCSEIKHGTMSPSTYNLFDFAEGQSLHIPDDFSRINGWSVGLNSVVEVYMYVYIIIIYSITTYIMVLSMISKLHQMLNFFVRFLMIASNTGISMVAIQNLRRQKLIVNTLLDSRFCTTELIHMLT